MGASAAEMLVLLQACFRVQLLFTSTTLLQGEWHMPVLVLCRVNCVCPGPILTDAMRNYAAGLNKAPDETLARVKHHMIMTRSACTPNTRVCTIKVI